MNDKYNLKEIKKMYMSGKKMKYIFFWGDKPSKDGTIKKSCLSQWWKSEFKVDNIIYKTAEHWMMAQKARLFKDNEILNKIINSKSPAEAKALGRKVKGFNNKIWNENRDQIVIDGNFHKFSQDEDLKTFLINTKDKILVEASPVDKIWGIALAEDNEFIDNPLKWKGLNLLGFALMEVRDMLNK